MTQKLVVFCLFLLGFAANISAQYDYVTEPESAKPEKKKDQFNLKNNLVFGGNVGLSFGNITYVQASPLVGVKIKPDWTAGVGLDYVFYGTQGFRNQNLYGGSLWSRYFIKDNFFITSQYQVINRELFAPKEGYYRTNVNLLFLGGGVLLGDRNGLSMTISGMYDIIEDPNSPYTNPVIRIGTAIGF
jgi:hypothetical protein